MNNELNKLPPPPKGQTGLRFEELNSLPPPPKGQKGLTLEEIMGQQKQESIGTKLKNRFTSIGTGIVEQSQALEKATKNEDLGGVAAAIGRSALRPIGAIGNMFGDVLGSAISKVTPDSVEEKIGSTISPVVQPIMERFEQLKQTNPQLAQDIEDTLGLSEFIGAGVAKRPVQSGFKNALETGTDIAQNMAKNKAISANKKILDEAVDITKPTLNKKGSIAAFERAGQSGGVNKDFKYVPSEKDLEIAESVRGVVSKKSGPIDNIVSVNNEIGRISESEISPFLKNNPKPFNFDDLRGYMSKLKPTSSLKDTPEAFSTYNRVREKVLNKVYKNLQDKAKQTGDFGSQTDLNQLWDSRKIIDDTIEEELGVVTFDTPQYVGVKSAAVDMRNALNNFINDSLSYEGQMSQINKMIDFINESRIRGIDVDNPETIKRIQDQFGIQRTSNAANSEFTKKLQKLSNMYEARSRIAETNYKLLDKNAFERWAKQNPAKWKAIKKTGLYVGLPAIGFQFVD